MAKLTPKQWHRLEVILGVAMMIAVIGTYIALIAHIAGELSALP